jgi:hypothetical protein
MLKGEERRARSPSPLDRTSQEHPPGFGPLEGPAASGSDVGVRIIGRRDVGGARGMEWKG